MDITTEGTTGEIDELMRLVRTSYPNANIIKTDIFKTFPPSYSVFSGEPYQYKNDPIKPNGFNMGYADSPLEAWREAWETVNLLMMDTLRS